MPPWDARWVRLLVVDDARQFKLLTEERGLCWVHEGRHFKQLEPHFAQHRQMVEDSTILGLLPGVAGFTARGQVSRKQSA